MAEENADVAQLVEQLIRNQQVNGSSPFVGSIPSQNCRSVDWRRLTAAAGPISLLLPLILLKRRFA
jgi:hypothetical protein